MKRLGRILLNAATVVSLLLCVATVALWVRSHWVVDMAERLGERRAVRVWSTSGAAAVETFARAGGGGPPEPWSLASDRHGGGYYLLVEWDRLGFGRETPVPGLSYRRVVVPYWSLLATGAIVPVTSTFRRRRARRYRSGLCPACGYDLRATPDRCPECGTIPA